MAINSLGHWPSRRGSWSSYLRDWLAAPDCYRRLPPTERGFCLILAKHRCSYR